MAWGWWTEWSMDEVDKGDTGPGAPVHVVHAVHVVHHATGQNYGALPTVISGLPSREREWSDPVADPGLCDQSNALCHKALPPEAIRAVSGM